MRELQPYRAAAHALIAAALIASSVTFPSSTWAQSTCLTRSAGFWCHHPSAAANFLPVTICGQPLDAGPAGSCTAAVEAMGSVGTDITIFRQRVQLIRQLTSAKLNLAATTDINGTCPDIQPTVVSCEALLCSCSTDNEALSDCIGDLDSFNNSGDSVPLASDPADPTECKDARDNGVYAPCGLPITCNP